MCNKQTQTNSKDASGIYVLMYNTFVLFTALFNPYPANVDNMASSYQC
jgi:hypothetical protein